MPTHETHKYKRMDIGVNKPYIVYKCVLNCPHYLIPALVIGRMTVCWRQSHGCMKEFELKKSNLKVKPTCPKCKIVRETPAEKTQSDSIMKVLGF